MTGRAGRGTERRASARIETNGSVVVHVQGGARGRVLDLSVGGIRVQLADGEPRGAADDPVALQVHLDGAGATWLRFEGLVRRTDARGATAIAFTSIPIDFAEVIQIELRADLEHAGASNVLVVDPQSPRRRRLAAALAGAGCFVVEAGTPLEAIAHLGQARARPWIVAIADTVPGAIADELRAYLADTDARVQLVSLGDPDDGGALTRMPPRRPS